VLPREPAAHLSAVIGGSAAGRETVNGVEADVIAFDQAAVGLPATAPTSGRIWLAATGGFVVRFESTTTGDARYFGEGTSGTLTTRYELTDVGASVPIELPPGCPAGLIDAPTPADSTIVESLPGLLRLTTGGSVDATARLYRDTALAFGWRATDEAKIGIEFAALSFETTGLAIDVLITKGDGLTGVVITARRI
jgi:hypothetical protein